METVDETLEVLLTLRDLRNEGKIRQMVGISNAYDAGRLATMVLHEAEIQVISNRWHEANAWDHEIVRIALTRSSRLRPEELTLPLLQMATVSENGPRRAGYLRSKEHVMYQCVCSPGETDSLLGA